MTRRRRAAPLPAPAEPPGAGSWVPLLALPALVYLAAGLLLGGWIIDDAGISYAYARNLAAGHGPVAEPGRTPVEGYSNFTWVVLLAASHALRIFHPVVVPKLLGAALALAALALVARALVRRGAGRLAAGFAALWIAAAPPIPIWTLSGLENGLTLLLAAALWARALEPGPRRAAAGGVLAALAAMTHPECVTYVAFPLGVALADGWAAPAQRARRAAAAAGRCLAAFALVFGPFLVLRLAVFGRPWPQPYYAKRVHDSFAAQLAELAAEPARAAGRAGEIGAALLGAAGPWVLAAALAALAAALLARRARRPLGLAAWLFAVTGGTTVVMEPDWMGEHRFATAATAALALTLALLVLDTGPARRGLARAARLALAVALTAGIAISAAPRLAAFAADSPTPYLEVQRRIADRFAAYARRLGLPRASILVEDVGATLYDGRLRVHDLTGLVEPAAIAALKGPDLEWRPGDPGFHDWVFETIRPTFVSTRLFWTRVAALERDPRFVRDYAPIEAYRDRYLERRHRVVLHSGDYVRRDALGGLPLDSLRAAWPPPPWPDRPAWRLAGRLAPGRGAPAEALAREAERLEAADLDPHRAAALRAEVAARRPEDREAQARLALALERAGRAFEARGAWERLLALERARGAEADAPLIAEIEARLGDPRRPPAF